MDLLDLQVECLEQSEGAGAEFIEMMDVMPYEIRERLRENLFNLCAACVHAHRQQIESEAAEAGRVIHEIDVYHQAIDQMNQKIRVADRIREVFGNARDLNPDDLHDMILEVMSSNAVNGQMPASILSLFDPEDLRERTAPSIGY